MFRKINAQPFNLIDRYGNDKLMQYMASNEILNIVVYKYLA